MIKHKKIKKLSKPTPVSGNWNYSWSQAQPSDTNITIGDNAVKGMMRGIKVATDAIRLSYGPNGCNAVVENEFYPFSQTVNDAQTIIQAIQVEDKVEKIGLNFLKELMDKAQKDSGDGRKTTAIIADMILSEGINCSISGVQLKKQLDSFIPIIEKEIDERTSSIDEENVWKVAAIAGEDEKLGRLIGEIYTKIGPNSFIHTEASGTYDDSYELIEGVRFQDTGYLSPYMVYDELARKEGRKETKAIYENPVILVTKRKIESERDIAPLIETMVNSEPKKPLVIFTNDMNSEVALNLIKTHRAGVLNITIVKAPILWGNYVFEDFSKITGATIIEDASGVTFKNLPLSALGSCGRIEIDESEIKVTGIKDISDHLAHLKTKGDNDSKLRLSWLTTRSAILRLGANNESELSYRRLKAYDAINASKLALNGGTVKGGGVTLFEVASTIHDAASPVAKIMRKALAAPHIQITHNMGSDLKIGPDIVDAAKITKNAVRNAIALASTVLTNRIVINLPDKSAEQIASDTLKGKGLRF